MYNAQGSGQILVDIGLPKDEETKNRGFDTWDGQIIHLNTRDTLDVLLLLRTPGWSLEQVREVMSSYTYTFLPANSPVELYDFTEIVVDEIIPWEPVPANPGQDEMPIEVKA
jgi:hypothetical protein